MSSAVRKANDRIRIAPSQLFETLDCIWLVLYDELLLCPENGRRFQLECSKADCSEAQFLERLVEGAKSLCGDADRPVGLLLPVSQFLYSHYSIQLADEYLGDTEMVHSAISLQKDLLLPAIEEEVVLAAAGERSEGVAFWFPESTLAAIEQSFCDAELELVAVLPRPLAAAQPGGAETSSVILDEDASTHSLVSIDGRTATGVLSAFQQDLNNADIKSAWDEQIAPLSGNSTIRMSSASDWLSLAGLNQVLEDYLFFTRTFSTRVENRNRQRQIWAGSGLAAAIVLLVSLPFVYLWADTQRLEGARDEYRAQARMAQSYLFELEDMEAEWGVVYEYPEADVSGILTSLNSVIRNSLTSFSLNDSVVEIQGFTRDPEQLTRLLVEQPLFDEIEQSRSISESNSASGDRFGLRLTLSGHDYPEYSRKYDFK